MKTFIAHRGLLDGPDTTIENSPNQILKAISLGFDVEVDIWLVNNKWVLGHDKPEYEIDFEFLNSPHFWVHCKNSDSLNYMVEASSSGNSILFDFFYHKDDDHILTHNGFIWTYPGKPLFQRSVCVMPEWHHDVKTPLLKSIDCFGVCTDYPVIIKQLNT
jgi:hypothetical protein